MSCFSVVIRVLCAAAVISPTLPWPFMLILILKKFAVSLTNEHRENTNQLRVQEKYYIQRKIKDVKIINFEVEVRKNHKLEIN